MIIEINEIPVTIIRKSIKNMYIRIKPVTGDVIVSVPRKLSLNTIKAHLSTKQTWIHNARKRTITQKPTSALIETGKQLFFLGTPYTLSMHSGISFPVFIIDFPFIHCYLESYSQAKHTFLLQAWQKEQMQRLLPDLIKKWEPIIAVHVQSFSIRAMKTRWGSCNTKTHRINLNLYLIEKPFVCLEYVLVHEMVHLLEARHNQRFYALMTQFMPNWKIYKKQLEETCHL